MNRFALRLKLLSRMLAWLPLGLVSRLAMPVGMVVAPRLAGTRRLERNLAIVGVADQRAASRRGIGFYARYWVDTFKLPTLARRVVDRRFGFVGYHHILDVQAAGATPIMVLPHLGSWEWAAAWLGRVDGQKVVAVVEELEPPEVFDWFREARESYGVTVVPLGPDAFRSLMTEVKAGDSIICLLADRDIAGNGVEVNLFGRPTTLPAGPALLSLRTGSPLLPVAIYDEGPVRTCHVKPPIWPQREGKLRDDVVRTTAEVASELEPLIRHAPDQWHVLTEVWPELAVLSAS